MNRKLLFAGIYRTLTRYKLRTFFMSLGIVLGVTVLVATRSLGSGAEKAMLDKIGKMFGAGTFMVSARDGDGPTKTLRLDDVEALAAELDEVTVWDPIQGAGAQDVRYEGRTRQVTVWGYSERSETVWNRGVVEGGFFTAADVRSTARVALVGTKTAEALFGDEDPVGRQILIGSVPFRVAGVLEPYGMDPHGNDLDDEIRVPITTLMKRLRNVDYIAAAKLVVADPQRVEETAERAGEILRRRHAIAEGEDDDFRLFTSVQVREMVARANRVLKVFLPAAGAVVLLVAAIVIANILLISVRERVPEIGLRKALGATDRQIRSQFLTEAVAVTLLSGLLGAGLGVAAVAVVSSHTGGLVSVTPDAVALGLVAASVVGVLAGYLPAKRAARLDPIEALR